MVHTCSGFFWATHHPSDVIVNFDWHSLVTYIKKRPLRQKKKIITDFQTANYLMVYDINVEIINVRTLFKKIKLVFCHFLRFRLNASCFKSVRVATIISLFLTIFLQESLLASLISELSVLLLGICINWVKWVSFVLFSHFRGMLSHSFWPIWCLFKATVTFSCIIQANNVSFA